MARVAIATFGSGGDLFPFVPVAQHLRDGGHDVVLILPRSLGLYTRILGLRSFPIGDGSEMRVYNDKRIYTCRFFGWDSWRTVYIDYVASNLARDVERIRGFLSDWQPDIVVTSSFAAAARLAALTDGHRHQVCSIYPQHFGLNARKKDNFPKPFIEEVARVVPAEVLAEHRLSHLVWGCDGPGTLLHDPALLRDACPALPIHTAGFPYWDGGPMNPGELELALDWLASSPAPTVCVTMGSFVGLRPIAAWTEISRAVIALGARALLIGAKSSRTRLFDETSDRALATGFLPLSRILPHVDAIAHHGGVGTMFAAARAGLPAVVVPQAFDQPFSATIVEGAGIGIDARAVPVQSALRLVLRSDSMRDRARRVSLSLVNSEVATTAVASSIVGTASGKSG